MNVEGACKRACESFFPSFERQPAHAFPPPLSLPTPTRTGVHCARCPIQRCLLPGRVVQEDGDDVVAGPLVSGLVVVWLGGGDTAFLSFTPFVLADDAFFLAVVLPSLRFATKGRKQSFHTLFSSLPPAPPIGTRA